MGTGGGRIVCPGGGGICPREKCLTFSIVDPVCGFALGYLASTINARSLESLNGQSTHWTRAIAFREFIIWLSGTADQTLDRPLTATAARITTKSSA